MARYWCIKCQAEVEHRESYCHSRCGNDCEAYCSRCNTKGLTTTLSESNPGDTENAALKWATGEAQRRMQRTGVTERMEVEVLRLDTATGIIYPRFAVYNPARGFAEFRA